MQITSGEWRYESGRILSDHPPSEPTAVMPIADLSLAWKSSDEMRANGRLLAASKRLLTALTRLDAHFDFGSELRPGEYGIEDPKSVNEAFAFALQAMAAAREGP